MSQPLKTFICYAREDRDAVDDLRKHLKQAEKKQLIEIWDDGEIHAGQHWDKAIKTRLEASQLILLLVSVDFINSDYIGTTELQAALQRHRDGEATLIPVIVRRCDWHEHFGIGQFQALPKEARPIKSVDLSIREEIYYEVAQGIKSVAQEMKDKIAQETERLARETALAAEAEKAKESEENERLQREKETKAKAERKRIKDKASWKATIKLDTIDAYENYLDEGHTLHQDEANQRIHDLTEAETKRKAEKKAKEKAERKDALAAKAKRRREAAQIKREEEKKQRELTFLNRHKAALEFEAAEHYEDSINSFDEAIHLHETRFAITISQLQHERDRVDMALSAEKVRQREEAARKKVEDEERAREAEEKSQREQTFSKKYNTAFEHERAGRYADAKTAFDEALSLHEAQFAVTKRQLQQERDSVAKDLADEIEQKRIEAQLAREAEEKSQREQNFSKKHNTALAHERAGRYAEAKTAFEETLSLHEAGFAVTINQLQQERDRAEKLLAAEIEQQRKEAQLAREAEEAARKKREQEAVLAAEIQGAKEAEKKKREAEEAAIRLVAKVQRAKADPFQDLMISIKGGTFDMGDTHGEGGASEKPIHKVTLSDFHLCKYPVSQAQWKSIMGDIPSHFKGDDLPVEKVSWHDVQKFIQKLNENTGKKYRLPTEAEWEYAAREGGKKVRFGNGKDIADPKEMNFDGTKDYKEEYSTVGEYRGKTTPVSHFKPNALGLHDMSGNVWEWCQDVWHENYKGAPDDGSAWEQGGDSSRRVVRGGSWLDNHPVICRASSRNRRVSGNRYNNFGLRLAR